MLFDGNDRTMRFLEQAALPFFVALRAERGVVASGERRVIRGPAIEVDAQILDRVMAGLVPAIPLPFAVP